MNLLNLLKELNIEPQKTAYSNGGEYHSKCPSCGGKDRFCVWPNQNLQGRYWCRQCNLKGDAIQFCRDFFGLSYRDACRKLSIQPSNNRMPRKIPKTTFSPKPSTPPTDAWTQKAALFLQTCERESSKSNHLHALLAERGLTQDTALKFKLVYNPKTIWDSRNIWGLEETLLDDKKPKKLWLPKGLVIPTLEQNSHLPVKLKIRRSEWRQQDKLPKYIEVNGSQQQYSVFGKKNHPIVLVEAELDAILLQQEANDLCCSIALGGANKRPDEHLHRILQKAPLIFFSLDFDEAGKKAYLFWKKTYPKLEAWPAPIGKSPSEAFMQGVCLKKWLILGIKSIKNKN